MKYQEPDTDTDKKYNRKLQRKTKTTATTASNALEKDTGGSVAIVDHLPLKRPSCTQIFPYSNFFSDDESTNSSGNSSLSSMESENLHYNEEVIEKCSTKKEIIEETSKKENVFREVSKISKSTTSCIILSPITEISINSSMTSSILSASANKSACSMGTIRPSPKILLISLCSLTILSISISFILLFYSNPIMRNGNKSLYHNALFSLRYKKLNVDEGGSKAISIMKNLNDVSNTRHIEKDVPFLWYIPPSADSSILDIFGACFHLSQASNFKEKVYLKNAPLYIVKIRGMDFVNVNLNSVTDIDRAIHLKLVDSNLADIVISPHLNPMTNVFTQDHKGSMLVLLRHPVEHALEKYYNNLRTNSDDAATPTTAYPNFTKALFPNNWLTRDLNNVDSSTLLTSKHLQNAKEIVRRKFLIGIIDELEESIHRFKTYFGWNIREEGNNSCERYYLDNSFFYKNRIRIHHNNSNTITTKSYPITVEKEDLNLLYDRNSFDVELYEYAIYLFQLQGVALFRDPKYQ